MTLTLTLIVILLGIGIVEGRESSLGKYQYSCNEGASWMDVNLSNRRPLDGLSFISVLHLRPNDKLRYNVTRNEYWSTLKGINK